MSLQRMVAPMGEPELTLTIRVAPFGLPSAALINFGMIRFVKRKWPMWFVANCSSMPSSLRVRSGMSMIPALLTTMLTTGTPDQEISSVAAARTDFWLERLATRGR